MVQAKTLITNDLPWSPTYSLSKNTNKFSIQRNLKVYNDNQVLLKKMMEIDKNEADLSQKKLVKQFNTHKIRSSAEFIRKKQEKCIDVENQKLMNRIQQSKSSYQQKEFQRQNTQNNEYKRNITRINKKVNLDYTMLAKRELLSDITIQRSLSTHHQSNYSKQPFILNYSSPKSNINNQDQLEFPFI